MEMESGETANKLEKVIGETFKELGVCASGNAKNFRATKTWWKIKRRCEIHVADVLCKHLLL